MAGDDEDSQETESSDSFLRELARAPSVSPDPQRVGRFRILGRLGAGGMGIVYRAEDESLRRAVAIKVLPPDVQGDDERRKRLVREARAAAAVTHPNLAAVYEVGEADGRVYIAMELVEGESLRAVLSAAKEGLPPASALDIGLQIARGLSRAHRAGIVHRDLKPENVIVSEDGHVKILDFGLAKIRAAAATESAFAKGETVTHEGRVMGTPAYMAPEQARGQEVTASADVFAFGVMLYEMLAGRRPFAGSTTADIAIAIDRGPPDPISALLDPFLFRCLARDAANRPADGAALLRALADISPETSRPSLPTTSSDEDMAPTIQARTPDTAESAPPTKKSRFPSLAVTVGVLAILMGVVVIGSGFSRIAAPSVPASSASASASAPAPVVTRITDLPTPPTTVPEAASEYQAGLQAYRDDSWTTAQHHFERAVALDTSMAAAHLRIGLMLWGQHRSPADMHEHFDQAQALRAHLTPRDQAFAEALEPVLLRSKEDMPEAGRRLEVLYQRFPADLEILDLLVVMLQGDPTRGLPLAELAIRLDPNDASAVEDQGTAFRLVDRPADARAAYEKAASLSLTTSDALFWLGELDTNEGRCLDYERHARLEADRSRIPGGDVIAAYVANGRPDESVEAALGQHLLQTPEAMRHIRELFLRIKLAIAHGDFVTAHDRGAEGLQFIARDKNMNQSLGSQANWGLLLIQVALERGQTAEAIRAAREYVSRSQQLAGEFWLDSVAIHRIAVGEDASRLAAFEAKQEADTAEMIRSKAATPLDAWYDEYAPAVLTPHDAERALAALERVGPLNTEAFGDGDANAGHVLYMAGRYDEALRYLRRAAVNCAQFFAPYERMNAKFELGEILSAKSDIAGACTAYGEILKWWGNAKPRSVTADKARARIKALACPVNPASPPSAPAPSSRP